MSAEQKAEDFNAKYPEGTPVVVHRDNGNEFETKTRSRAFVVPRRGLTRTAVIFVDDIAGYYLLDRVEPIKKETEDD